MSEPVVKVTDPGDYKRPEQGMVLFSVGDFAPVGRIEEECLHGNFDGFLREISHITATSDLNIVNLECPLTKSEDKIPKTGPNIKADPVCAEILKKGNFHIACMANNHILDFGEKGLTDTLEQIGKMGVEPVGAGKDINEAGRALFRETGGFRFAFLNYAEHEFSIASSAKPGANPFSPYKAFGDIREAKKQADLVIVFYHGGIEYFPYPTPRIREIFRFLADAGASAVIGHHSHAISGFEIRNGVPLIYSLGNFLFDEPDNEFDAWFRGMGVALEIDNATINTVRLIPFYQCREKPEIERMDEESFEKTKDELTRFSGIISSDEELKKAWGQFAGHRERGMLKTLLNMNKFERLLYKMNIMEDRIIEEDQVLRLLNYLRCESHHELAVKILEKKVKQKK